MTVVAPPGRVLQLPAVLRVSARGTGRLLVAAAVAAALLIGIGPRIGLFRPIVVLGPSMGRTLPLGSVVISTAEPAGSIRAGQIISFRAPVGDHQVETHRVVKVISAGPHPVLWTKGDANTTRDPWAVRLDDSTVWVARTDIPYAGYLLRALRSRTAHDLLVVVVPALWALLGLWALWAPATPASSAVSAVSTSRYRPAHRARRGRRAARRVAP